MKNGKDTLLTDNPGTLPQMSGTLSNWFQRLTFVQVVKTLVNFKLVETLTNVSFMGVRQPLSPQKLMVKPEGQRAWRWQQIHALPDLVLKPDDIIVFASIRYRVMEKLDFKEYGFVEYHIIEDYNK